MRVQHLGLFWSEGIWGKFCQDNTAVCVRYSAYMLPLRPRVSTMLVVGFSHTFCRLATRKHIVVGFFTTFSLSDCSYLLIDDSQPSFAC
ncbi:hypothetical protein J2Z66_007188 [Paenibacillus eucommiae]|uniref:Uncharacterized protein n=1 Tax=Paenibacillus eucommiae TaxID=1355755 RepID=A0ABS4J8Z6_9BACL|nr:hypothetical protein [Paenibacillus eucommiae]